MTGGVGLSKMSALRGRLAGPRVIPEGWGKRARFPRRGIAPWKLDIKRCVC